MFQFKYFCAVLALFLCIGLQAQGITGTWKTIDDESGEAKSHVQIFEKDGKFFGKIVKLLPAATATVCENCPGDKKGKSLVGMEIVENLEKYKDYFSYGTIMDPASGKIYKCSIWREGKTLKVRGYIGFSLLGRNQTWHLVE